MYITLRSSSLGALPLFEGNGVKALLLLGLGIGALAFFGVIGLPSFRGKGKTPLSSGKKWWVLTTWGGRPDWKEAEAFPSKSEAQEYARAQRRDLGRESGGGPVRIKVGQGDDPDKVWRRR